MSFVPADPKFDAPEYIDLHFWNPNFVEPPAGLEPWYDSSKPPPTGHYNASDDKYHQTFSMSFCKWDQVIDASVWIDDEKVRKLVPTLEYAAAQILWELTFYSFEEGKTQELWENILGEVETFRLEAKEEKKKGA